MRSISPRPDAKRFVFDTVFDGEAVVRAPRPQRAFSAVELEAARRQGFAEGEGSATARAEAEAAKALVDLARAARIGLGALTRTSHQNRLEAAELALIAARKIAGAALAAFPDAPAAAALKALAAELEAVPHLQVRAQGSDLARLKAALEQAAEEAGYVGRIVVRADPSLPLAAFVLDWGDGKAAFDPAEAAQRVEAAVGAVLTADAQHPDPVLSPSDLGELE
jgi:flagellar assembly protein FliH